ncbi:MAG: hypothetical protein RLZZ450_4980 [Pseudomonadota bacterium]|jgi:hypothetical protein
MSTRIALLTVAALATGACSKSHPDEADAATTPAGADAGTSGADARTGVSLDAGSLLDAGDASSSTRDAQAFRCDVPADCLAVTTTALSLTPCCSETVRCGLAYRSSVVLDRASFYTSLGLPAGETCIPDSKLFHTGPTTDNKRVPTGDGGQVLQASDCPTSFITSIPLRGCCLPTNECAITSYPAQAELKALVDGMDLPFTRIECVKAEELNAQLRASPLAGYARVLSTTGSCNYGELDRTLPRNTD